MADCSLLGGYTLSCFAQVPVGVTKALGLRRSDAGARAAALKEPPHGRPARHTRGPRLRDEAARLERFLNTLDIYVHIQIGPRPTENNARPSPWSCARVLVLTTPRRLRLPARPARRTREPVINFAMRQRHPFERHCEQVAVPRSLPLQSAELRPRQVPKDRVPLLRRETLPETVRTSKP